MNASETPSAPIGLSYRDAGVDIEVGDAPVDHIRPLAKCTMRESVLGGIDGFGTLFGLSNKYQEPVLVSGANGVGTKLKLALALNRHDTVGQDLVAMNVNGIPVQGAEPLSFLDYSACGRLDVDTAATVVKDIVQGCELAGCALTGGKTAEMLSMYPDGGYDSAGFAVGAIEKREITDGTTIAESDVVLGLASSGAHSNGHSLVRKTVEVSRLDLNADFHGQRLQDAITAPMCIYAKPLLSLIDKLTVKGMAHITGGGLTENMPRVLQDNLTVVLHKDARTLPPLFQWLQKVGSVANDEIHRVLNCGTDTVVIVSSADVPAAIAHLKDVGETVYQIGEVHAWQAGEAQTIVV